MQNEFFKGAVRILYMLVASEWIPFACLTSTGMEEDVDMIPTTTRENGGWETARPVTQRANIPFEGVQIVTTSNGDTTKVSYDTLKTTKRNRTQIEWKIEDTAQNFIDQGNGYINQLSEAAPVGDFLTYSGNITVFGQPTFTSVDNTFLFQDGDEFTFQDGETILFN